MADTLQKFIFENAAVRGELVELSDTWRQVQSRRAYPKAVQILLGEMLSAAALLSANLKFNGSLIMQIHGDGPVRLLVVECNAALQMRATAKLAHDAVVPDDASLRQLVTPHGNGRFVITLDPLDKLPGQQPYQGIVPLDGDTIAAVIEHYMLRSEQLDTKLWLAADGQIARGLLLQKLPNEGGIDAPLDTALESWNRMVALGSTLKNAELLETDIATLMRRLFWEETIRIFEPAHPNFHCSC
ncbi:MAG: Hsp33 family molecular chaperone HslO, partial [Proteobacteria bacterium]|nr:Hsp33 family molecular chaperone HslO [Pseudomonadota bacterium]